MVSSPEDNKRIALEAFDLLFNKRDYAAAAKLWSESYIQHSLNNVLGRDELFEKVRSLPANLQYENALVVADDDYVMLYGRFSGCDQSPSSFSAEIIKLEGGQLTEHWDMLEDD